MQCRSFGDESRTRARLRDIVILLVRQRFDLVRSRFDRRRFDIGTRPRDWKASTNPT